MAIANDSEPVVT